jgi:hypothetical protein
MKMNTLVAYHGNQSEKDAILAQLAEHRAHDQIVKGQYWEDGKGCAVGCTIHGSGHKKYEPIFGIPQALAHIEDAIFEGLPNDRAMDWPIRFMAAIKPGSDLSLVQWKFLHWLLTDENVNPGINHPTVKDAIKLTADLMKILSDGGVVSESAAESAAWSAEGSAAWISAESARSAGWSAAESTRSAAEREVWSAAWSARSAAWSAAESAVWSAAWSAAESAVWSARSTARSAAGSAAGSARSAAESAGSATWSAAVSAAWSAAEGATWSAVWSARSAVWSAAESAAFVLMSDKLIDFLEAA